MSISPNSIQHPWLGTPMPLLDFYPADDLAKLEDWRQGVEASTNEVISELFADGHNELTLVYSLDSTGLPTHWEAQGWRGEVLRTVEFPPPAIVLSR